MKRKSDGSHDENRVYSVGLLSHPGSWARKGSVGGGSVTTKDTRRSFLKKTGTVVSLAFLGQTFIPAGQVPAASVFIRRNVGGMNAFDPVIAAYERAVTAMRALPSSDPTESMELWTSRRLRYRMAESRWQS